MKRLLITTLIVGVAGALGVGALHASKAIAGFETVAAQLVSDYSAGRGSALFTGYFSSRFPPFLHWHSHWPLRKAGRLFCGETARIWCERSLAIACRTKNFAALMTGELRLILSRKLTK